MVLGASGNRHRSDFSDESARLRRDRLSGQQRIARVARLSTRPGAIDAPPSPSTPKIYGLVRQFFPLLKPIRSLYVTGDDIGRAMIQATVESIQARVITNVEIRDLADRARKEEARS